MREIWFERTTAAILRDAFRVDTQVPNAKTPKSSSPDRPAPLPGWLYNTSASRSPNFSRYDLRKTTEGPSR
jgi:hypothetical protein